MKNAGGNQKNTEVHDMVVGAHPNIHVFISL